MFWELSPKFVELRHVCTSTSNTSCRLESLYTGLHMSTLEELPLQAVESKEAEESKHPGPLELDDAAAGTRTSTKGATAPRTTSRWKTLFTTVATLIAYAFLNAGISMITPFYPIVVSCKNHLVCVVMHLSETRGQGSRMRHHV